MSDKWTVKFKASDDVEIPDRLAKEVLDYHGAKRLPAARFLKKYADPALCVNFGAAVDKLFELTEARKELDLIRQMRDWLSADPTAEPVDLAAEISNKLGLSLEHVENRLAVLDAEDAVE